MSPSTTARVTTDHEQILCWAEKRGAKPAYANIGDAADTHPLRLTLPGDDQPPQKIEWADWFHRFDKHNLALLYQEQLVNGDLSNFHQIIARHFADKVEDAVGGRGRSAARRDSSPSKSSDGSNQNASIKRKLQMAQGGPAR